MRRDLKKVAALMIILGLAVARVPMGQDLQQMIQQKAAALKQSVADNRAALQQYSWIEKTELSLKGEVKNTKVESCQYGPDGEVHKTPISVPPPPEKKRGLKGKVIEKKTGEMKEYMERATSLVGRYVAPSPEKIQAVISAGKASLSQAGPGAMQLIFRDYVKTGDSVTFTVDSAAKVIRQLTVNTYLDEQDKDAISLTVNFQTLPDGTNYTASKMMNVAAKNIVVNIQNMDYKKLAQ